MNAVKCEACIITGPADEKDVTDGTGAGLTKIVRIYHSKGSQITIFRRFCLVKKWWQDTEIFSNKLIMPKFS